MILAQRRETIRQILLEKKSVSVANLSEMLNVSGETIRRDLDALSDEGFCKKNYGGATLNLRNTSLISQSSKRALLQAEKQMIAHQAAQFIRPNDCIFLDYATTTNAICPLIHELPLTVVTNSLSIAHDLVDSKNIQLILTGGKFKHLEMGLFGPDAEAFIRAHYVDKAFFSPHGLDPVKGIFDATDYTANLHRLVLENSNERYLLADHTKMCHCGFANVTDNYRCLTALITDKPLNAQWQQTLSDQSVDFCWKEI